MNILITGSEGQLGQSIKKLAPAYPDKKFIFTDIPQLDLSKPALIDSFLKSNKIEYLVNCAAYNAVDKAESDRDNAHLINVEAVGNLAKLSTKYGFRLIHLSTDYVFDGKNYKPYLESDTANPLSIYAQTKYGGEQMVQKYANRAVIIRTSWLYSEFGHNFLKTIAKLAMERDTLEVVADQTGSPTYAGELAKAILAIINKGVGTGVEIYHFSNEGVASWYDFAHEIIDLLHLKCKLVPVSTNQSQRPAPRPHYSVLNKDKFTRVFQYSIPHWKISLKQCIRILESYGQLPE